MGLAIGQIVGGLTVTIGGITSATGIGAAIGVPAIAAAGLQGLSQALMSSGSGSAGSQGAAPAAGGEPEHHIMTNKNRVSTTQGGPWTPRFEDMAKRAGMTLDDAANRVRIPGHRGPHPEAYHQEVFNRLRRATRGLQGDAYSNAFRAELDAIRIEAATAGSGLNRLLTGQ
ncbi:hypothetical protein BE20_16350 [Sorangium cellulosum]|nr:hypothetical protein BE20_16350 [Sorangium cellulosum]